MIVFFLLNFLVDMAFRGKLGVVQKAGFGHGWHGG